MRRCNFLWLAFARLYVKAGSEVCDAAMCLCTACSFAATTDVDCKELSAHQAAVVYALYLRCRGTLCDACPCL